MNEEKDKSLIEEQEFDAQQGAQSHTSDGQKNDAGEQNVTPEIETLANELNNMKDKYLRLVADFENYKKRTAKERFSMIHMAGEELIKELLPVLDDFERAQANMQKEDGSPGLPDGIDLIYLKFKNVLEKKGVQPITYENNEFDAEIHEAITEIPAPNVDLKGKIVDTIEKGYYLHDKIIRHPKVVIGK